MNYTAITRSFRSASSDLCLRLRASTIATASTSIRARMRIAIEMRLGFMMRWCINARMTALVCKAYGHSFIDYTFS